MKLIELMLQAGIKWPVGAMWAAQDGCREVCFFEKSPSQPKDRCRVWDVVEPQMGNLPRFTLDALADDWNTHAVSRDEYQAAGGWMLWEGGECPVEGSVEVEYEMRNGQVKRHVSDRLMWGKLFTPDAIVAYRVVVASTVERIAEAANIQIPAGATVDTLCEVLREQDDGAIQDHDIVMSVAEALGCNPDDILDTVKQLVAAPTTHTIYHGGELYRDSTILLQTEQTLVWRCDGSEYTCKPAQALIDPNDNGLAAAILARLSGADVAPEHVAEMREQMGWA